MNNLYVNWFDLYKYKNEFILNKGLVLLILLNFIEIYFF